MVRMMITPKTIEDQFIKKVKDWLDENQRKMLYEVFKLPQERGVATVNVALCIDGRSWVDRRSVEAGLYKLFSALKIRIHGVQVDLFSFDGDNVQSNEAILNRADVFWFAGVHDMARKLEYALRHSIDSDEMFEDNNDSQILAVAVRRRVQYDNITYVGVCGGGYLAGRPHYYSCGLELLNDLAIEQTYDIQWQTHGPVLQFSRQCAFVVLLNEDYATAMCFPVVKNSRCREQWAADNTTALQALLQRLQNEWKEFMSPRGQIWHFNLRGYCCTGNDSQLCH